MKLTNKTIIILILIVATILRFFNYFEIPFTHDEFSALFRLNFDSFSDLIEKGVKVDGHPAGIQVFEYYWTKLFGYQEWIVKLPFTLFGIASVYLIYLIGKKWFNETVGLLSAAFLATIQFTVMYSQIARPYISGMFFSLMMVYYWSHLMMNPNKKFYRNTILFIIFTSLCTYNHHFSLLFSIIVGLSGLFIIQKKYLLRYVISGLLVFVLYIPHLQIFFYQLNVGGVEGWLGKPQNDFLIEFICYLFNYSTLAIAITIIISLIGLKNVKKNGINIKFTLLALAWFILPFLIGFYYSRYVNAVLQFSVLIFSFPFLYFVLFGHLKEYSAKINLLLVSIILITNILTLICNRNHYDLFYNSIYKRILTDYKQIKNDNNNSIFIIDSNEKILEYYIPKLQIDTSFINYSESFQDSKALRSYLEKESENHDKLFLGCLSSIPSNVVPLIQDYFSNIEIQNNYFGGTVYLFNKDNYKDENVISNLDFDSEISDNWSNIDTINCISFSESNNICYTLESQCEWGPAFSIPLDDIVKNKNNFIDISISILAKEKFGDLILVGALESNGENIYWGGSKFEKFELSENVNIDWIKLHHSIKLSDINLKSDDIILKIYIWNRGKKNYTIDDFKIKIRKGNPVVYGLSQRI